MCYLRSHLAEDVDFLCTPCGEGVLCPVGSSIAGLLNSTGNPNEPRVVNGYSSEQLSPLNTCSLICFRSSLLFKFFDHSIELKIYFIFRYLFILFVVFGSTVPNEAFKVSRFFQVPLFGVCLSWWSSRNLRWRPHWPNLRQVPSK